MLKTNWLTGISRGCFWQQSIPVSDKLSSVSSPKEIGNGNKLTEMRQEINMETLKMVEKILKYMYVKIL